MEYDEFGFPKHAGFGEERPRKRAKVSAGRIVVLAGVVLAVTLAAVFIEYGDDILRGIEKPFNNLVGEVGGSPEALLRRIDRSYRRGDFEGARQDADRLVALAPKFGEVYRVRATILGQMGRYRESVDDYTRAIEAAHPVEGEALAMCYNNRAYNRALAQVDLHDALDDVNKALKLQGDLAAYIDTRGYIYYLLDRQKNALADMNRILDHLQDFRPSEVSEEALGEMYFHRGLIHRELGETALSERDFDLAKKLGFEIKEYPKPIKKVDQT